LPLYQYECASCKVKDKPLRFDVVKPMVEASHPENCGKCGENALRIFSPTPNSFGWRLTDASHEVGNPDELERDI